MCDRRQNVSFFGSEFARDGHDGECNANADGRRCRKIYWMAGDNFRAIERVLLLQKF